MAISPEQQVNFPVEQEIPVSMVEQADLRQAMNEAAKRAFQVGQSEHDWHIQGIPLYTSGLFGRHKVSKNQDYHFLDVRASLHPNVIDDDPNCSLYFHGHPMGSTKEEILGSDGRFSLFFDDGPDHPGLHNLEQHSGKRQEDVFEFLYGLLGRAVPLEAIDLDTAYFNAPLALASVLPKLAKHGRAESVKVNERLTEQAVVGSGSLPLTELIGIEVSMDREHRFAPERTETLTLIAKTSMSTMGVTVDKELRYKFQKGTGLDSDRSSARLKLSSPDRILDIEPEKLNVLVNSSLHSAETGLASELIAALDILP